MAYDYKSSNQGEELRWKVVKPVLDTSNITLGDVQVHSAKIGLDIKTSSALYA